MRLDVDRPPGRRPSRSDCGALNEAVVEKSEMGHTVRLDVELDGRPFTSYVADGLILATPTGSTAYAFSVRGPIVDPRHRAVLMAPVAPHMLFDRSLVLASRLPTSGSTVAGRPGRRGLRRRPGRRSRLSPGDVVVCTASDRPARLVTFGERDFHAVLRTKFGLGVR